AQRTEDAEVLARVGAGETIDDFDTVRLARYGRALDVSLTVSPIRSTAGEIVRISTIAQDITERRRFDETRARLAAIVEPSEDVIVSKTLDARTAWPKRTR